MLQMQDRGNPRDMALMQLVAGIIKQRKGETYRESRRGTGPSYPPSDKGTMNFGGIPNQPNPAGNSVPNAESLIQMILNRQGNGDGRMERPAPRYTGLPGLPGQLSDESNPMGMAPPATAGSGGEIPVQMLMLLKKLGLLSPQVQSGMGARNNYGGY